MAHNIPDINRHISKNDEVEVVRRANFFLILAAFLFVATRAMGHHGSAPFDTGTRVTLEGVITEFDYRNPHSFVYLRTTDSEGNSTDVTIEAVGSSGRVFGVTEDSLRAGESVIAIVNPSHREPDSWGLGVEIIKEDGSVVPLSVRFAREMEQKSIGNTTSIAGVWVPRREDFFSYVLGRSSLPVNERGAASLQSYDNNQSSHARCISVPPPTLMLYGSINVVEILDDRVLIHSDWMDAERVIFTDGRGVDEFQATALHGNSIGQWEGRTLVVESTGFSDNNSGTATGIASGPQKRMHEQFELADDGSRIDYSFVVEDPEYLSEPVTGGSRWDYRPDLEPDDAPCDLESAGRYLTE